MGSENNFGGPVLAKNQIMKIKSEIKRTATEHLHSRDAKAALSHFSEDVIAVSNDKLIPTFDLLAEDVIEYYKILKKVNHAAWKDIHIQVIDKNTASFIARFRYSFTDINDEKTDLEGIWTALYARYNRNWKICLRHESFHLLGKK
jgi:ketosteroid isomerase-like protein